MMISEVVRTSSAPGEVISTESGDIDLRGTSFQAGRSNLFAPS